MKQRNMSLRLEDTRKLISPSNRHKAVRMFRVFHGSKYIAGVEYIFIVMSVASSLYYDIDEEEMFKNLFMSVAYVIMSEGVLFWANNRHKAEDILIDLTLVAETLETCSNKEQLSKLIKVSNEANFLFNAYFGAVVMMLVQFLVFPIVTKTPGITIPFFPENLYAFWLLFTVESTFLVVGCIAAGSVLTFHLQATLCMSGLFQNLSDHFLTVQSEEYLNTAIQNHVDLLIISANFRTLCSHWTFVQTSMMALALVINTFSCIRGSRDPGIYMIIPICLAFIGVFCLFGESLIASSEKVARSAYGCKWLTIGTAAKRKLSFVIHRSQTPEYLGAGLVGTLSLQTYAKIMKLWYNLVQGLLKIL